MYTGSDPKCSAVRFFPLVFVLTTPWWLLARYVQIDGLPDNLPITDIGATFIPMLAAIVLVQREAGMAGVRQLLARVFDWRRIERALWAPLLLAMPAIFGLTYVLMRIAGWSVPHMWTPSPSLGLVFLAFFIAAAGEEFGYTAYLTDRMRPNWSMLGAGLVIGVPWALWHLPSMIQLGQSPALIVWGLTATVAFRVIYVWLYNATGRSMFAVTLIHAIANTSRTAFPGGRKAFELGDAAIGYGLIILLALFVVMARGVSTPNGLLKR